MPSDHFDFVNSMNQLKIANEAPADIAKAGVVDIRYLELDAIRMISVLFSFSRWNGVRTSSSSRLTFRIE